MQSMTGYGRGLICEDGREMTVEVKSVNHRFLDVSFRLARPIAFLDDAVRSAWRLGFPAGMLTYSSIM